MPLLVTLVGSDSEYGNGKRLEPFCLEALYREKLALCQWSVLII